MPNNRKRPSTSTTNSEPPAKRPTASSPDHMSSDHLDCISDLMSSDAEWVQAYDTELSQDDGSLVLQHDSLILPNNVTDDQEEDHGSSASTSGSSQYTCESNDRIRPPPTVHLGAFDNPHYKAVNDTLNEAHQLWLGRLQRD